MSTSPLSPGSAASSASVRRDELIRPFAAGDIAAVADLHRRVFRTVGSDAPGWRESYRRYFTEVFLGAPIGGDGLTSLVCEDRSGRVVGFLGVVPRPMVFKGRPILMAVCSQFVVDPSARGQVGLRLVKHCLAGPQDLSMTDEAESATERIWQWCGGTTALLHSLRWIRPLRPAGAALAVLSRQPGMTRPVRTVAHLGRPATRLLDALLVRLGLEPFHTPPPTGSREDLDAPTIHAALPDLAGDRSLLPAYDEDSVRWMLERAGRLRGHGTLRAVLVRDEARRMIGWFVYYVNPGEMGQVLQIAAKARDARQVLDHLLDDAVQRGVAVLAGRLDPPFVRALSDASCLLHRRGYSVLVHSRRPELLQAILRGDAFLSRLDGEWCLRYQ